jgi:hypothetical protein
MLPPPAVEAPTVSLAWNAYNHRPDMHLRPTEGTMDVPDVPARAWRHEGRDLWLVANVTAERQLARVDGRDVHIEARDIQLIEL